MIQDFRRDGRFRRWSLRASGLATAALFAGVSHAEEPIAFNRDVRPILSANCFHCHGQDSAQRKADLRLDQRDAAVSSGAIKPGKPDESGLVERVFSTDAETVMPPAKSRHKLTDAEKQTLRRWVAEGAVYQPHWSFIPATRPTAPPVKESSWVRNPIDAFVLATLEKKGLKPAPEADRRTLARRLSLDLNGLPPKPELVDEFVNDNSPKAYENLVDKLLQSPRYGEHRARYWLDAARYADTHGLHFDNFREMWSYRDWVINAFNKNLPFDRFTIEQLAGDLLPNATLEQRIASGFNRCLMTTNEGGTIPEENLVLYTRDRTETTGIVFLGLTINCAVCHDHKFDPITQKEFYSLAAFFNNTTQGAMDGNIKDTPPIVSVPMGEDRSQWEALGPALAKASAERDERMKSARPDFEKWLTSPDLAGVAKSIPMEELRFYAPLKDGQSPVETVVGDAKKPLPIGKANWPAGHIADKACSPEPGAIVIPQAGDFDRTQAFSAALWVKLDNPGQNGSIVARMDEANAHRGWDMWLEGGRVGIHLINKWPENAIKVVSKNALEANRWTHVVVSYNGTSKAKGVAVYFDGKRQEVNVAEDKLSETIRTPVPLKVGQRHTGAPLKGLTVQDFRLYGKFINAKAATQLARATRASYLAAKPAKFRAPADTNELQAFWLETLDPVYQAAAAKIAKLEQDKAALVRRGTIAFVMEEKNEPAMAYVLFRGEYDKRRDPVKAATPAVLPAMPNELPKNRLGFAQWLVRPENPLVARVAVNRFWQEVFGTGIVRTAGDFGITGDMPSHPELLDWLAVEFRESGWDVKKLFRTIVLSATYRQSAQGSKEAIEKDPNNRLLARGPRFRMDAEMIRDYALAASDLLVEKVGGPSVRPYQPEGVWEAVAMYGSNTRDYKPDKGGDLHRRGLYTFWKRAAPPASMDILNAPSREFCTVKRERTNTPLQALVTLNDPTFVEAARRLAERSLTVGGESADERLDYMTRRVLSRSFSKEEREIALASLGSMIEHYRQSPSDAQALLAVGTRPANDALRPDVLAAWTMLANEIFNLDEALCK